MLITTLVVSFLVCCMLEARCGYAGHPSTTTVWRPVTSAPRYLNLLISEPIKPSCLNLLPLDPLWGGHTKILRRSLVNFKSDRFAQQYWLSRLMQYKAYPWHRILLLYPAWIRRGKYLGCCSQERRSSEFMLRRGVGQAAHTLNNPQVECTGVLLCVIRE